MELSRIFILLFTYQSLALADNVRILSHFDKFYNHIPNLSSQPMTKVLDSLLSAEALSQFNNDAVSFESEDDETRRWRHDWETSIELVDPQKYLFIKNVTQLKSTSNENNDRTKKIKYSQLLPSDIHVNGDGNVVFKSYVNNLNPTKYKPLYASLEKVIGLAIPAFEEIIHAITIPKEQGSSIALRNRDLQVVIAMRNLIIPKNYGKEYEGSKWHQEGLRGDEIIASAIYYRDVVNVNDAKLSIRVQLDESYNNFTDFDPVISKTNRLVAIPNIYEHRVEPFEAIDKNEVADRKLITIALVNPLKRVISTGDVLPQREEWLENGKSDLELGADLQPDHGCCKINLSNAKIYYEKTMRERLGIEGKQMYVHGGK